MIRLVCEKFGLDYETAKGHELSEEMLDYYNMLTIKLDFNMLTLLVDGIGGFGNSSLEAMIGDIYAFNGSREVITTVCKTTGLDPATTKVQDLTDEQIIQTNQRSYEISDHPK